MKCVPLMKHKQDGVVFVLSYLLPFPMALLFSHLVIIVIAFLSLLRLFFFFFSLVRLRLCRYRCQTTDEKKKTRLFFSRFFSSPMSLDTSTKCRKEKKTQAEKREIHVYKNECLLTIQRRP